MTSAPRQVPKPGRGTSGEPGVDVRATWALWGAAAVGGFAQSLAGSAGALLAVEVAGSDAAAGLPQAALVAGSAAAALALSVVAVRRGRRASLATGAGVAVAGCALVTAGAAGSGLAAVLVGSLLLGAGNTAVMLARYAAADLAPGWFRARAMGRLLVATTVGAVLGPNLLGPADVLGARLGLPSLGGPYLVAGLSFAVAAATLVIGLPGRMRPSPEPADPVEDRYGAGATAATGLAVLGIANLVMIAVMTMAPVQLHHLGHGLTAIGAVVSLHIAAMFAPSPWSSRLADRFGPGRSAAAAGAVLVVASVAAAAGSSSLPILGAAMALLGLGWNVALISGSLLLTAGVPERTRPRREGWGEVSMGLAAAAGGGVAGPVVAGAGYATLAVAGALTAGVLLAAVRGRAAG